MSHYAAVASGFSVPGTDIAMVPGTDSACSAVASGGQNQPKPVVLVGTGLKMLVLPVKQTHPGPEVEVPVPVPVCKCRRLCRYRWDSTSSIGAGTCLKVTVPVPIKLNRHLISTWDATSVDGTGMSGGTSAGTDLSKSSIAESAPPPTLRAMTTTCHTQNYSRGIVEILKS